MNNLAILPSQPSPDNHQQLSDAITLLAGQLNAGNYRLLKLIAQFDDCKAWSGGGTIRSCAHWLNWKCGIALGAAREKVRVAHCLESLPLIDTSLATGEISYSKVRAMTGAPAARVGTPENEDFLLAIAQHGTASHVEQVVAKYKKVAGSNEDKAEVSQEQARKLVYYQDDDGMWVIHAKLPAEAGSLVVKAIEAVATTVQQEQQKLSIDKHNAEAEIDVSAETRSAGHPDATLAAVSVTAEQDLDVEDTNQQQDTFAQARADALITMAEHFLATSNPDTRYQGLKGSERCQIMLHVDINTLRGQSNAGYRGNEHCDLDGKHWVCATTAKRLACDATLVTVSEDGRGKVLNIGRRARTVPASIKRALTVRDKTCRFPGCCESRYVDAHHIQHWADGGETSLENLVTLCRYHHRQLHKGNFSIRVERGHGAATEAHMVFSTPSGKQVDASFFPQFLAHAAVTAADALLKAAPAVDAKTCITRWRGESCDYGLTMDALLRRDAKLSTPTLAKANG